MRLHPVVPLLVLLVACDAATATATPTPRPEPASEAVRDTGDPAVEADDDVDDPRALVPTSARYAARFAVDEAGALRAWAVDGVEHPPSFVVELADGDDTCTITYALGPDALAWAGQPDADPALAAFLEAEGLLFGVRVAAGTQVATTSPRCAHLPRSWGPDVAATALTLRKGYAPVAMLGLDLDPAPGVLAALAGPITGVTPEQVLGGRLALPFPVLGADGTPQAGVDVGARKVEVGPAYDVVKGEAHPTVPCDRDEAWVDGRPGAGAYDVVVLQGIVVDAP